MDIKHSEVMFTGGAPGDSVEQVFRMLAGAAGDRTFALPDGENGERSGFVTNLNHNVWPKVEGLSSA